MSLEEQHEALHRRGELIKFLFLVLVLVGTVFMIALLRPLIFDRIVPAVLGWEQQPSRLPLPETTTPEGVTTDEENALPVIMTATPSTGGDNTVVNEGAPLPTPRIYRVEQGDTLAEIAERYGLTVRALAQANGISDPNRIQPGDVLVIPEP